MALGWLQHSHASLACACCRNQGSLIRASLPARLASFLPGSVAAPASLVKHVALCWHLTHASRSARRRGGGGVMAALSELRHVVSPQLLAACSGKKDAHWNVPCCCVRQCGGE